MLDGVNRGSKNQAAKIRDELITECQLLGYNFHETVVLGQSEYTIGLENGCRGLTILMTLTGWHLSVELVVPEYIAVSGHRVRLSSYAQSCCLVWEFNLGVEGFAIALFAVELVDAYIRAYKQVRTEILLHN